MVEQAVQTVPSVSGAQRRGNALTRPQNKQSVRPAQRSGWEGSQVQKENIPTSKQLQMRLRPLQLCLFFFFLNPFLDLLQLLFL